MCYNAVGLPERKQVKQHAYLFCLVFPVGSCIFNTVMTMIKVQNQVPKSEIPTVVLTTSL